VVKKAFLMRDTPGTHSGHVIDTGDCVFGECSSAGKPPFQSHEYYAV
jgi:hypothetical protein